MSVQFQISEESSSYPLAYAGSAKELSERVTPPLWQKIEPLLTTEESGWFLLPQESGTLLLSEIPAATSEENEDSKKWREWGGKLFQSLNQAKIPHASFDLSSLSSSKNILELLLGIQLASYRYHRFVAEKERIFTEKITLIGWSDESVLKEVNLLSEAISRTKDLVNDPGNIIRPKEMRETAQRVAKEFNLTDKSFSYEEAKKREMGGFCCVAQGSENRGDFIVLEYNPPKGKGKKPIVFIGKGVTFDTGGISLKNAANMGAMKGDMAGAATVLGAMQVIAGLKLEQPVVAILPCAENMPDGEAFRPGDVITTYSGKRVEITSTDAEGRMLLCDALTYGQKEYDPLYIVDMATLTGACMVGLGEDIGGLFANDDRLRKSVEELGAAVGDPFAPLPLYAPYRKKLKSSVADFKHGGDRWGGAITAALYLEKFVEEGTVWSHLDIAGPGAGEKSLLNPVNGGTAMGLRTLVELVRKGSL